MNFLYVPVPLWISILCFFTGWCCGWFFRGIYSYSKNKITLEIIIQVSVILLWIFKTPKGTRTSWSDVPVQDWYHFSRFVTNGCGGNAIQNKYLDKYLFGKQKRASCIIHDWYFAVGGNIYDFIRANFTMFGKQVEDAMELRSFSMFFASFLYLIATSTIGAFYFNWGDYRSVKEIIY